MSAFDTIFAGSVVTLMAVFGESVVYRKIGQSDITITAIPTDPVPEDNVPGQYTVRAVRSSDLAALAAGDKFLIGGVLYDVFAVRRNEGDPLSRVFLSKA